MKIRLRVDVDGEYFNGGAIAEVPELMTELFRTVDLCEDPLMAILSGGHVVGSAKYEKVIKKREDAARILAKELTRLIISEMNKHDTQNGYDV